MWSLLIKWRGIAFRLHPLFVLILLASIATGRFTDIVMLFGIVLWHELGHLFAAIRFGWTVREVKLLPFGGVMEVEEAGTLPAKEEAWVAAAGPAQNALLAGIAWGLSRAGGIDAGWADDFVVANALIGLFNLLPMLPLDGGRILQAWISCRVPYHSTLLWCARVSLVFSALLTFAAFVPMLNGGLLQLNLLAVGMFLFASNWYGLRHVPFVFLRFLVHRSESSERRVKLGVLSRPIVISENLALFSILRLFMKEQYHLVYVMNKGKIANVVPEKAIIDGFLGRLSTGHADLRFFR
jgi:stage IV sporulation protein FB